MLVQTSIVPQSFCSHGTYNSCSYYTMHTSTTCIVDPPSYTSAHALRAHTVRYAQCTPCVVVHTQHDSTLQAEGTRVTYLPWEGSCQHSCAAPLLQEGIEGLQVYGQLADTAAHSFQGGRLHRPALHYELPIRQRQGLWSHHIRIHNLVGQHDQLL